MVRTTYLVVEEWPAIKLGSMAMLVWMALGMLKAASRIEPYHPGSVFIVGRMHDLESTLLGSFGRVGEFLSKKD